MLVRSGPYLDLRPDYVPILLTEEKNPANWLSPIEDNHNYFTVSSEVARPRSFELKPFYKTHDRRYSVYWDLFNEERWNQHQLKYQAELKRIKELEAKTIDFFQPGEMQEERNHNFEGEKTRVMDFRHQKARVADRGGWFSFELNVNPGKKSSFGYSLLGRFYRF